MEQGSKGRALNAHYSLRRKVVPSKRFENFYLEKQPLSKKKDLQTREKLTSKSGETLASSSSQSPLPVSILSGDTLSCGDNSSALPQILPGSSFPAKNGCESTYKVSETMSSTILGASEHVGHRRKQAKPCRVVPCEDQAEQALEIRNVPLVTKLWSPEQKSVASSSSFCLSSSQSHIESQTPMDSTPQAPKVAPPKTSNDLEHRLGIATMILQLAQDVPALIPEARCTVNLQKELLLLHAFSSKGHKSTSGPKKGTSVKACAQQWTGSNTKGCSKTPMPRSTGKHGQKRKHLSSLDSGPEVGPEWRAARDKEDFPHLEDSSLMAEAKERERRELALESSLRQMAEPVEERHVNNAAVPPHLRPLPPLDPSSAQSDSLLPAALREPLLIHGHNTEDYQAIYHSVVHPMLKTKSGNASQYNLGMGCAIKQHLWEKMSCPTLVETVDSDGRVHITESSSTPTLKSCAPQTDVDISGEPKRKRARR